MRHATHLLVLLAGLNLAAQASTPRGAELDELAKQSLAQKCPSLRGRYSCRDSFMLSYKKKKKHEMKVVQSERDGIAIFLFEASDGADGFWAVGDGTPHAYASEAAQAWGFQEIDTEANCPKPESLEIRFMVQPGLKKKLALSSARPGSKGRAAAAPARRSGMLTFTQKQDGKVQITAHAYPTSGHRGLVESTTCQRIEDPNDIY
jgi:hypothetical protein